MSLIYFFTHTLKVDLTVKHGHSFRVTLPRFGPDIWTGNIPLWYFHVVNLLST